MDSYADGFRTIDIDLRHAFISEVAILINSHSLRLGSVEPKTFSSVKGDGPDKDENADDDDDDDGNEAVRDGQTKETVTVKDAGAVIVAGRLTTKDEFIRSQTY